jgi:hypothetical protein
MKKAFKTLKDKSHIPWKIKKKCLDFHLQKNKSTLAKDREEEMHSKNTRFKYSIIHIFYIKIK